jgi:ATP-binding cassette subfamily B protein
MGMGMPPQKAKDFKGTFRRLVGYLRPYRFRLLTVLLTAVLSTIFSIISPKLMENATTKLFEGIMGKMNGVPGAGIDFDYILQIVLILLGLYLLSAVFGYIMQYLMAGVAQKTVYDLRREVSNKLTRMPLNFFDSRTHGEIMSRAVNDVDNISGTLQQSLTQLITSVVTILGVIVMMLTISPLLTVILVLTIPLSFVVVRGVVKRSQQHFVGQQKHLGELLL